MTDKRTDMPDEQLRRDDETFARQAGAQLRDSTEHLDAATLSRLNRARQRALDEMPGRMRTGWWGAAGVTAVAATVVVGIWQSSGPPDPSMPPSIVANDMDDFELLLEEGDLEMIEDLEFFAWPATEDLESSG